MFFLGVLFMQHVLGYSAIGTGVAFLPVSLGIGVLSLGLSARLNTRFGPKATLQPGLAMLVLGLVWLTRVPVHASYAADLLPSMLFLGVGAGLSFPSMMTLAMSGATPTEAGLASGLVNTTLQVGGALGLAILATLSTTRTHHLLTSGSSQASALTGGYHLAWVVSASIAAAALAVAFLVLQTVRTGQVTDEMVEERPAEDVPGKPAYSEAV
jgi:MFS family permease